MPYYCNINACRVPHVDSCSGLYICIVIYPKNTLVVRLFGHYILPYMAKYHAKSK